MINSDLNEKINNFTIIARKTHEDFLQFCDAHPENINVQRLRDKSIIQRTILMDINFGGIKGLYEKMLASSPSLLSVSDLHATRSNSKIPSEKILTTAVVEKLISQIKECKNGNVSTWYEADDLLKALNAKTLKTTTYTIPKDMTDQAFFKLFADTTHVKNKLATLMNNYIENEDSLAVRAEYEEIPLKMDNLLAELGTEDKDQWRGNTNEIAQLIQLHIWTPGPVNRGRIVANKEDREALTQKINPFIAEVAQDVEILNFFEKRAVDEMSTPGALLGTVVEEDVELGIGVAILAMEGIENKRMMAGIAEVSDFLDSLDTTCAIM
jgi:hypothetical protein